MDSELVSSSLSATEGGGQNGSSPLYTYTEKFYELFPYYLAIGMTPEQYWEGDCTLVKYYRKAEELRNEKRNQELWLQGMYVYEALCDASPLLQAFAKKGTKAHPYADRPYSITSDDRKEEKKLREQREREKAKQYMLGKMASINKQFNS